MYARVTDLQSDSCTCRLRVSELCFRSAQVSQVNNFCLWATGKMDFFQRFSAGHPGFNDLEAFALLVIFLKPQP